MQITTYHIHNVLRAYGKQLSLSRRGVQKKGLSMPNRADTITISAEARRKAVIEKVTADIVERIVRDGPQGGMEHETFKQLEEEYGNKLALREDSTDLVFKVIDKKNGEEIRTLSIEDSRFLKRRLEEITKSRVDANMFG